MSEEKIRQRIVDIAKARNIYFVVWYGHFGDYFLAVENNSGKTPNVYSALYESINDLVSVDDKELFRFKIDGPKSWAEIMVQLDLYLIQ